MRLGLAFCLVAFCFAGFGRAQTLPKERVRLIFDGIECEYSPGQEKLARALAARFAQHNEQLADEIPARIGAVTGLEPLSVAEMRANRAVYLGRIAALLALEKPTALQENGYDAFLANYEETMILFGAFRTAYHSLQVVKRVTVWERTELANRLQRGEKIPGMTYDSAAGRGNSTYGGQAAAISDRLAELETARRGMMINTSLNLETKDGVTNYRARFELGKRDRNAAPAASVSVTGPPPAGGVSEWFPVVVPTDRSTEPPEELAHLLWEGLDDSSVVKVFDYLRQTADSVPRYDPRIAFLILHETTEIGIIDHYFRGRDRRWFCDGVANYVAWRVLRDLHGEVVATRTHNLPAQLHEFADLRDEADLRKWPAVENEPVAQTHSRLEVARYAFAERAIALMEERGGKDALPRLFAEIGKTGPDKVTIKTVEKAWQKLTHTKLGAILGDAVKPLPPPIK